MPPTDSFLRGAIGQFDSQLEIVNHRSLGGGCINNAIRVETTEGFLFIKWNSDSPPFMFEKETRGLELLSSVQAIGLPKPLFMGNQDGIDFLILEYLEQGPRQPDFWEVFGKQLAALHRNEGENHGLDHSNYIGRLEQLNDSCNSWIEFFINQRLRPQVSLAVQKGLVDSVFEDQMQRLYSEIPNLIPELPPSLLHGDLWSGNFMTGPDGRACLIDPAVYYGSREMELAFTQLFGGFDRQFYRSYNHHYPLESGFDQRVDIYNLYPLLVHLNLFGSSYMGQILRILKKYS